MNVDGRIMVTLKERFGVCEKGLYCIGERSAPFTLHTVVNVGFAFMTTVTKKTTVL